MRILLDNLQEKKPSIQVLVLQIFSEIFKSESMAESWGKFVELLTLRILDVYTESARDVSFFFVIVVWEIEFSGFR